MTKISLIDDDQDILDLYEDYLLGLGYKDIDIYQDSKEFGDSSRVERLVKESDIIICDIKMPEVDGREVMDRVIAARKKLGRNVIFIFISGIPKDYYPCTSEGWGALVKADEVIGKPISMDEMKDVLRLHGIYSDEGAPPSSNKFMEESA